VLLEVIATSVQDSVEAEAGGAGRIELLSAPEQAGLTPPLKLVEDVLNAVRIPVRVMLREYPAMSISNTAELVALKKTAAQLAQMPVDGVVTGFIKDDAIDVDTMAELCGAAPGLRITFHRAFDALTAPAIAIEALKQLPQVDRILTYGAGETLAERLASARNWGQLAAPRIRMMLAAGHNADQLSAQALATYPLEIHVGRAARDPQTPSGPVSRARVAELKRALDSRT
jgi:copper homeostasis protein